MCDFIIDLFNIDKEIIKNIENFFSVHKKWAH